MEQDGNNEPRSKTAKIRAIAASARWLVPLTALAVIALSRCEPDIGAASWAKAIGETVAKATGITGEAAICIFLACTVLVYWAVRERREAAADLAIAMARLSGIPGMATVAGWVVKGATFMFATLKRKVYEQIRSEGRAEGRQETNAEWQAWWRRRTATGEFVSNPDDPPPHLSGEPAE